MDAGEVARFDALAARWWDPHGPMRPLHAMNPARIGWIAARIGQHYGPGGRRLLDVGCGAGLAAEALSRLGHEVLGIDAAPAAIAAAQSHAEGQGLPLAYRVALADEIGRRFEVVTALEVVEHVPDPAAFLAGLAQRLEPGGLLLLSTLNRTPQSFLAAKLGAEYLLRWLPVGTHDWRRFLTPVELAGHVRAAGLRVLATTGLGYTPAGWRTGGGLSVNYLMAATLGD